MADAYGQAASNLVAGSTLESTIQQILDMGGGSWDRDTVVRALRAAYNNPERAVDYLYSVSTLVYKTLICFSGFQIFCYQLTANDGFLFHCYPCGEW